MNIVAYSITPPQKDTRYVISIICEIESCDYSLNWMYYRYCTPWLKSHTLRVRKHTHTDTHIVCFHRLMQSLYFRPKSLSVVLNQPSEEHGGFECKQLDVDLGHDLLRTRGQIGAHLHLSSSPLVWFGLTSRGLSNPMSDKAQDQWLVILCRSWDACDIGSFSPSLVS